jgi:hypothetical protein
MQTTAAAAATGWGLLKPAGFGSLKGRDAGAFSAFCVLSIAANVGYFAYNQALLETAKTYPSITTSESRDFNPAGLLVCPTIKSSVPLVSATLSYAPNITNFLAAVTAANAGDFSGFATSQVQHTLHPASYACPGCPDWLRKGSNFAVPCIDVPLLNRTFHAAGPGIPAACTSSAVGSAGAMCSAPNLLFEEGSNAFLSIKVDVIDHGDNAPPGATYAYFVFAYVDSPGSALEDLSDVWVVSGLEDVKTIGMREIRTVALNGTVSTKFDLTTKMVRKNLGSTDHFEINFVPLMSVNPVVTVHTQVLGYGASELFSALLALLNTTLAVVAFLFPTSSPAASVPRYAFWNGPPTAALPVADAPAESDAGLEMPVRNQQHNPGIDSGFGSEAGQRHTSEAPGARMLAH